MTWTRCYISTLLDSQRFRTAGQTFKVIQGRLTLISSGAIKGRTIPGIVNHYNCTSISHLFRDRHRRPYNLYCVGGDVKPCSIKLTVIDYAIFIPLVYLKLSLGMNSSEFSIRQKHYDDGAIRRRKNFDNAFSRSDTMPAWAEQPDGQTDGKCWPIINIARSFMSECGNDIVKLIDGQKY